MKFICDNCKSNKTIIKNNHHKVTIKGKIIEFDADRRFCSNCNSFIYDEELDDNAIKKGYIIYNRKYGIEGEEIRKFRKNLNISIDDLSKIIGCAKKTLISYENNTSVPNDIYLITLKTLMDNPEVTRYLIESNKERYTTKEYEKITWRIYDKLPTNFELFINHKEKDFYEFNGYSEFSLNKTMNLIKILSKDGINKTKLLKEMFYVDFLTYNKYMYSLTGLEYIKLPYGPVPDNYEIILKELEKRGIISYQVNCKNNYEECVITSIQKINEDIFTEKEMDIINNVIDKFKDYKVSDIVEYSHKEKAFIETKYNQKIDYSYALDLINI